MEKFRRQKSEKFLAEHRKTLRYTMRSEEELTGSQIMEKHNSQASEREKVPKTIWKAIRGAQYRVIKTTST